MSSSGIYEVTTTQNNFGLFRRYRAAQLPIYDPEEHLSLENLSDISTLKKKSQDLTNPFAPYPNRSSFLLGDWFWNDGVQKSLANFKSLITIVTDPDFSNNDIANVKWDQVNEALASDDGGEWLDDDAGWTRSSVSISVPFQTKRGIIHDGSARPQPYTIHDFHHRSLVSVIKEKITSLQEGDQFHFEPYELLWQKAAGVRPVHVQGEIYSSPAFLKAHRDLQESPRAPGCNLARVVIALMFWSDATHLAAFGPAKLWPLYLFFGNESKYLRCKPSCHTCEHIAYFQTVCT